MGQNTCRFTIVARCSRLSPTVLACLLPTLLPIAFGQVSLTTAQIAKRVSPAVVVIQGKTETGAVLGSGFIISKDGKMVTNLHVIRDMKTASVQLANGEIFDSVSVLAVDERRDLAIIKIAGFNLTTLELGDSDSLTVAEPVVVVGSPLGFDLGLDATVTAGILSAIRNFQGVKFLQTDAAVNHGNSGGPLVAASGLAVGVVSSIVRSDSAQGLNFAIPINYVRGLLDGLHDPMTLDEMRSSLTVSKVQQQQSSGPSLKETLGWLKETIRIRARVQNIQPLIGSFDSCIVQVGEQNGNFEMNYTLPLGLISSTDVKPWAPPFSPLLGYRLFIKTKLKDISYVASPSADPGERFADSLFITFSDESIAQRVAKAFLHAADLCRKKEPF